MKETSTKLDVAYTIATQSPGSIIQIKPGYGVIASENSTSKTQALKNAANLNLWLLYSIQDTLKAQQGAPLSVLAQRNLVKGLVNKLVMDVVFNSNHNKEFIRIAKNGNIRPILSILEYAA